MSENGVPPWLRVALVLSVFVILGAIGWAASLALRSWRAGGAPAPARPAATSAATPPPVVVAPTPALDEARRRLEEAQARLQRELRQVTTDPATDSEDAGQEPYRVGGDVTAPVKIAGAAPGYTELARRARINGVVILEATIERDGSVGRTRVLKSLPFGLDTQAREAVATWRFEPARRQGRPVAVYTTLTVKFQVPPRR